MALHSTVGRVVAAALIVAAPAAAFAETDGASRIALADASVEAGSSSEAALATDAPEKAQGGASSSGAAGALQRQTPSVRTGCFPARLRTVLDRMGAHFGSQVIVTSGYRSAGENRRAGGARRSMHVHCLAADIQMAGVSPAAIARYAKAQPEVGGVGTYRHTRSIHVDVGARKFSWHGRGSGRIRLAMR